MSGDFFKVYRKIFQHEIWKYPVDFRLFFYILGNAVYKKDGVVIEGIHVQRGQWLRSYRNLQKDLEYREKRGYKQYGLATIKRSIQRLIKNGLITVKETECGTLFTVVNYEKYQGNSEMAKHLSEHYSERNRNDIGTTSEQKEERKKDKNDIDSWLVDDIPDDIQQIENHFIQRRGLGTILSANDMQSMQSLLDDGFNTQEIIQGIDYAFDNYKPKHKKDGIKRFAYCETVIRALREKRKGKVSGFESRRSHDGGYPATYPEDAVGDSYYDQFPGLFRC